MTEAIKKLREAFELWPSLGHEHTTARAAARAALDILEAELAAYRRACPPVAVNPGCGACVDRAFAALRILAGAHLAPDDNPPREEELPLRPALAWFAQAMERKLRANDHKRGWSRDSVWSLLARVQEELNELESAASASHGARDPLRVLDEAADVANMAMMVADVSQSDVRVDGWDQRVSARLRFQQPESDDRRAERELGAWLAEEEGRTHYTMPVTSGFRVSLYRPGDNDVPTKANYPHRPIHGNGPTKPAAILDALAKARDAEGGKS